MSEILLLVIYHSLKKLKKTHAKNFFVFDLFIQPKKFQKIDGETLLLVTSLA